MHNIEQHGDQAAFMSARKDAWHQLGTTVPATLTAEDALHAAHLDNWNVRKHPLSFQLPDGTWQVSPGAFANVRDNPWTPGQVDTLGVVGNHYESFQNEDGAALLNALVDESGAHFETAGSLGGGKQTFVTMKLPEHIMVGGVDQVDTYIAALNSHDGNSSFKIIITPVRIVCANTQQAALSKATQRLSRRHTAGGTGVVINDARYALDMTFQYVADFEAEAQRMIDQAYTDQAFSRLTASLFPTPKGASDRVVENVKLHRTALAGLWKDSDTATTIKGTRWGAYQAVTEYLDHTIEARGKVGEVARESRALAAINADSGSNKMKARAWDLLTATR